jgi:uncharacterized protein (TIGR04255 family)
MKPSSTYACLQSRSPGFEALTRIVEGEEARYPSRNSLTTSQFTVDTASGSSSTSQELVGYRFISADKSAVVQARRDGFSFSKLPPYQDWEEWQPEARRLWQRYKAIVAPDRITRVAVRYINRVRINRSAFDLREYFRCFPELPDSCAMLILTAGFTTGANQSLIPNQGIP